MDPYLEDPARWPSVHALLIAQVMTSLNRLLPPAYWARIEERLYVVQPDRRIAPDVSVRSAAARPTARPTARSAAAVAETTVDPAWEVVLSDEPFRETFVEILGPAPDRTVVCVIEVLSPANKAPGGEGRRVYLEKQREVLASDVHLLELDLLRHGEHTVAVPREQLLRRGSYDYLVCLSRADARGRFTVWARTVRDRLPRFLVPLLPGDGQVALDLQELFTTTYDAGVFSRFVDYVGDPDPPLSPPDAQWARSLLTTASAE
jgi:hypothetical protein